MNQSRPSQAGFSLLEVMIASSMLAVGVLGLTGMQVNAINANKFAGRATQATLYAQELAAQMKALRFDDLPDNTGNTGGTPDGFVELLPTTIDISPNAERDINGVAWAIRYDVNGKRLAGAAFDGTEVYQAIVMIIDQDLNLQSAGMDAKRIKVVVRYRDGDAAPVRYRESSVIAVRPKGL